MNMKTDFSIDDSSPFRLRKIPSPQKPRTLSSLLFPNFCSFPDTLYSLDLSLNTEVDPKVPRTIYLDLYYRLQCSTSRTLPFP